MKINTKLHILLVSAWYKSNDSPLEGSFVEEQARMLQRYGHKVSVLHPFLSGTFIETLKGKRVKQYHFNNQDLLVKKLGYQVMIPGFRKLNYRFLESKACEWFRSYIMENGKPDILHSHSSFMGGIVAARLSREFNIPLIHTEHTSGFIENPGQYNQSDIEEIRNLYYCTKYFFFVSSFALEASAKCLGIHFEKASILHNLVDPLFFEADTNYEKFKAVCIANFSPNKNQIFLLKVWNELIKSYPESKLYLYGDDFDHTDFRKTLDQFSLQNHVVVNSRLNRAGVKEAIQSAHVLLSSSKVETFGLTIAEALAMGKPVVVTDSGGPRDILNDGDGFLVEQNDINAFVEAIKKIWNGHYDHPHLISQRCAAKFSSEVIYAKLFTHYQKVLESNLNG